MNKTYRSVWNDTTGTWVAVQENAKGHGKKKSRAAINLLATGAGLVASMSAYATTLDGGSVAKWTQVAIGQNSKVTANTNDGGQGIAIGVNAISSGSYAVAAGGSSNAAGDQSVAVGNYAHTTGTNSNSVGFGSLANGAGSNAIGAFSTASGNFSTAIGNQAFTAANGVALGAGAKANTINSVALGTNSVASSTTLGSAGFAPGGATLSATTAFAEVSMGAAGSERRITNVAAGYGATDAVNVSQLMAEDARVSNVSNNLTNLSNTVNNINTATGNFTNIINVVNNSARHACRDARRGFRRACRICFGGQHQKPGRGAHACRAEDRGSLPSRCGGRLPRNRRASGQPRARFARL
ncbi:ESPR-type extended signal peptide-containing protein [Paraburkholderia terrae]